jgi:hypothetical protein
MTATPARRRRGFWLLAAALLLGAGALLSLGAGEPVATSRAAPDFPDRMRTEDWKRQEDRATWTPPAAAVPAARVDDEGAAEPDRRDPLLVALPVKPDAPLVVFEANALRHSRLGEAFVRCMLQREPDTFAELERETGVDVLKDVERVAFAGDAVVVSGFFDRARWDVLEKESGPPARYGDAGRIYARSSEDAPVVGVWRDQIVVFADKPESVRQALDQLEGRAPVPASGIPDDMAYGEVYGVLPGAAARQLMPGSDAALAARIAAAASRIELHVDAMSDVAAVVRVVGDDGAGLKDLAKTLAGGLAAARVEAQVTADHELAELLEFAKVVDGEDRFSVELALPADRLEKWFGDCKPPVRVEPAGSEADGDGPDAYRDVDE